MVKTNYSACLPAGVGERQPVFGFSEQGGRCTKHAGHDELPPTVLRWTEYYTQSNGNLIPSGWRRK